jgi:AcrR family transcriptional regulator
LTGSTKEMLVTSESDPSTPQARRRANTNARLREALALLAKDPSAAPTVAGLARAAGVGRNIIYTHHSDVLDALRDIQSQREGTTETAAGEADSTRATLHDAIAKNIALATHNASLLNRAVEAEQRAERLERRNAQLVQELDRIRRPVPIRTNAEAPDPTAA